MEPNLKEQLLKIYIHRDSLTSALAERVMSLFPEKIEIVTEKPLSELEGELNSQDFSNSKRLLYIAPHKGLFFKRCPGAKPGLTCCNYFVLNLGLQCNMNCSYCYLQSYINTPVMTVFSNIDIALSELKTLADNHPHQTYRVGTGETTDSLSLDELTLYSRQLIQFFSNYPAWRLEFKTKSSKVDQFIETPHAKNVICSWSLNPAHIVETEEHQTASLEDRLLAAQKCRNKDFLLSFHIDPMIWHPEWKDSYRQLVKEVTYRFSPDDVTYITVGALRFQPEQRHIMRERFKNSYVTSAEVFQSRDGKMRYDLNLRTEMFEFIKSEFQSSSSKWRISLCMEVPETWSLTMASSPTKIPELKDLFIPLNAGR